MNLVYVVLGLALLQFLYFGAMVGRARGRYGIKAPATTGHDLFERHFRVQMNTLELLVVLVPSLPIFGWFVSAPWAAGLGAVYLLGRFLYFFSYVKDPAGRSAGFALSILPVGALVIGGIVGAVLAMLRG